MRRKMRANTYIESLRCHCFFLLFHLFLMWMVLVSNTKSNFPGFTILLKLLVLIEMYHLHIHYRSLIVMLVFMVILGGKCYGRSSSCESLVLYFHLSILLISFMSYFLFLCLIKIFTLSEIMKVNLAFNSITICH